MSRPWRIEYIGALYHLHLTIQFASLSKQPPKFYLRKAEKIFKCDVQHFVHEKRFSGAEKEIRDVLLYGIWRTGQLKNEQIGNLFGLSYSGVKSRGKISKTKNGKKSTITDQIRRS